MSSRVLIDLPPVESTLKPAFRLDGRRIIDILADVNAAMKAAGIEAEEYGFNDMTGRQPSDEQLWPAKPTWIGCYPVRGDNEGYYVHITLVFRGDQTGPSARMIGLAKTYSWRNALELAAFAAGIFEGQDSWKYRT